MTDVKVMSVTFLLSAGRSRDRDRFSHGSDVPYDYISQVDCIEKDSTWDGIWTFEKILTHQKAKPGDKNHQGSGTNCLVLWSTGEQTWEPALTQSHWKVGIMD